jgi:hypothetical protein
MSTQNKFKSPCGEHSVFSQFAFVSKGEFTKLLYSPLKRQNAGTIQPGNVDFHSGPLRLIEIDEKGHATGWQAETTISVTHRNVQKRPLDKITRKFWEAAGYENKHQMIDEMISSEKNRGRKLTPKSLSTALLFEPVGSENIVYRSRPLQIDEGM